MSQRRMSVQDQLDVLKRGKLVTIALCRGGEPYLVTLNYTYLQGENCLYCHCATEGKKLDFIRANSLAWGQVLEDNGYLTGKCSHAYRTVMLDCKVELVQDQPSKRRALELMIDHLEENPEPVKKGLPPDLAGVAILRLAIRAMDGKQNPPAAR